MELLSLNIKLLRFALVKASFNCNDDDFMIGINEWEREREKIVVMPSA